MIWLVAQNSTILFNFDINNREKLSTVQTYDNGYIKLNKDYSTKNPVKVIVTFLEDVQSKSDNGLALTDFSFSKSKKNSSKF